MVRHVKQPSLIFFMALVGIFFAGKAAAQADRSTEQSALKEGTVPVHGMVIDQADAAWPGLTVEIRPKALGSSGPQTAAVPVAISQTDKEGQFTANLAPGPL